MADFDPDSYLAAAAPTPFNPDEYLNAVGKPQPTPPPQTFAPGSPREIAREQLADQPVVQQQMERAGRAVADTAVGTVKSLPSMLKFIAPPKLTDILAGASETLGQIKQIEQSPVGSQEWWNAVVPVASQVAMEVGGLRVASPKLTESIFGKPPVQTDIPLTSAAEEVTKNASKITGSEGVTQPEVRPRVGEEAPLRQQGETSQARQEGTQVISPSTEAAAVSGAETPPAAAPQIPEGAKATVKFKTATGELVSREMDAKEAEGIFTKEKSSYQALLDCLGA